MPTVEDLRAKACEPKQIILVRKTALARHVPPRGPHKAPRTIA